MSGTKAAQQSVQEAVWESVEREARELRVGAIWAQDRSGVLGADGAMLWRVPADFKHFKAATLGGAVVMGRTTWESLGGRPLPGRLNLVLSRRPDWQPQLVEGAASGAVVPSRSAPVSPQVQVKRSLAEALAYAAQDVVAKGLPDPREGAYRELPRVWVIGGGSVYKQALNTGLVDELLVTELNLDVSGRTAALDAGLVVRAPQFDAASWQPGPMTDAAGTWRPVSGDAAWRVEHWLNH
ncbi:Dihydrofolate reductase [Actinomyces bovis]|uniref:dihydrofolate reductase n=1 Tax=Actinomyces bovis TaxID=1658 RepID=A0ABY1VLT1_9ACTO|nr:dihydrofolate reductase [Actinomyces bovis]SPT53058.1 Dihydrofolate reductase [Actinomyces bovis]VEG53006.1 Dihydrofolate reductase [Actinomyces israelii]